MRALHLAGWWSPLLGGSTTAQDSYCRALLAAGCDVVAIATDLADRGSWIPFRPTVRVPHELVRSTPYTLVLLPVSWPTRFSYCPRMATELRHQLGTVDIVHVHSLYRFPALLGRRLALQFGIPYVVQPHGALDPFIRSQHTFLKMAFDEMVGNFILRDADMVVATTEHEKARLGSWAAKASVVPVGIAMAEWEADVPRVRAGHQILFVGRLARVKALDLLIDAFARVNKVFHDATLVIAGPDEGIQASLAIQADRLDVAGSVFFMGPVSRPTIRDLFASSSCVVIPSYSESLGVAALEAMAAGVPIVLSSGVAIADEVARSRAGIVVDPHSQHLAEAIARLLRNPEEATVMAGRAKRLVQSQFGLDASGAKLAGLYREIIERRHAVEVT